MIEQIHNRLRGWSEWVRSHPSRYAELGFSSKSTEARLMRTAPGTLTLQGLPRVWICNGCEYRHPLYGGRPLKCKNCGGADFRVPANIVHGHEAQGRREAQLDDNPEAEATDRAIGALGIDHPALQEAIFLRYLREYSLPLTAQYLHVRLTTAKAWLDQAHCWLDGYLLQHQPQARRRA